MKQLIALFIALSSVSAFAQSSYDMLIPRKVVQTADIQKITNFGEPLFPEVGTAGEVIVDKHLRTVSVNLVAIGLQDTTFRSPLAQIQLTLVEISKDPSCLTTTYRAVTDPRSLSRVHETLTVVDNTKNICETFRELAPTEITYVKEDMEGKSYTVFMTATGLQRMVIE